MLSLDLSVVDGFSMKSYQQEPLRSYKGKKNKPTKELRKKELYRRGVKGAKDKNINDMISLMKYFLSTDTENDCVKDCVEKRKLLMQNIIEEVERDSGLTSKSSGNMNREDNIRLMH